MNPILQPQPTYPGTVLSHLTAVELQTFQRLEFLRGIHARTPTNDTFTRDFPRQNLVLVRDPADGRLYWAPSSISNFVEDFAGQHEFITSAYEEDEEDSERLVFFVSLRQRTIATLRIPRRTLDMLVPSGDFNPRAPGSWVPIVQYITTETIVDLLMRSVCFRQAVILEAVRVSDDFWSHGTNNRLRSGDWILQSRYENRAIIRNYDDRLPLPCCPF
ncbi:hypothetical protein EST38_g4021 [Candolleomyces aberdarensis]|uniref:Uncharacterized protein n=1 Tax=Candolleomyces aberdarensis TaxID=2316362 RepID=A0A4Q2DS36_9AGAR|nr:hypothetical protein EST38_g4021 [Candolleomyces aberdarensis]